MNRSSTLKLLGVMACAICIPLAVAAAQSVALGNGLIQVNGLTGPTATLLNSAWWFLGGNGWPGRISLQAANGINRVFLDGADANLFLGGGNADGDVRLTDTDGVTTTIDLNGEFGLATLGSVDDDGDLWVMDNDPDGLVSIGLDGASGNVTNQLGTDSNSGNGLVKAWARMSSGGTLLDCWRCDPSPTETKKVAEGDYVVSFSPLGADIRSRPRLAVLDLHADAQFLSPPVAQIFLANAFQKPASVEVFTQNSSGDQANRDFTLFIF